MHVDDSSLEEWSDESIILDETISSLLNPIHTHTYPDFELNEIPVSELIPGLKVSSLPLMSPSLETLEILPTPYRSETRLASSPKYLPPLVSHATDLTR